MKHVALFIVLLLLMSCASVPVQEEIAIKAPLNSSQEIAAFLEERGGQYNHTFQDGYSYELRKSEVALIVWGSNLAMYLGVNELFGKTEFHAIDLGLDAVLDSFSYHFNGVDMEGFEDYEDAKEALPGNILHLLSREDRV